MAKFSRMAPRLLIGRACPVSYTHLDVYKRQVVNKHYPVYPVCSKDGVLLGLVRGQTLFEARAIEISACLLYTSRCV